MSNWIFLSRNKEDEYINMFANGCGQDIIDTDEFVFEDSIDPIILRGILKKKIIQKC